MSNRSQHRGRRSNRTSNRGRGPNLSRRGGRHRGNRKCLAEMQDGEEGTIAEIGEEIRDTVVSMGVRPGKRLVIHNTQPLNGPVVVSVGQSMTSMSQSHARQIEISVDGD